MRWAIAHLLPPLGCASLDKDDDDKDNFDRILPNHYRSKVKKTAKHKKRESDGSSLSSSSDCENGDLKILHLN